MKHLIKISIILAMASVALFSCDDKPEEDSNELNEIDVHTEWALEQTIFADQTEGVSEIVISTTGAWTATYTAIFTEGGNKTTRPVPPWWLNITPNRGEEEGAYEIFIHLAPNYTRADRKSTIHIACKGDTAHINITQLAIKENGEPLGPPLLVTLEASSYVYCGAAITPAATVTLNGATLTAADYTLMYDNNTDAGYATVTVEGKGDYEGSTGAAYFTIARYPISVTAHDAGKTYWDTIDPELTYSFSPALINGDVLSGVLIRKSGTAAGKYDIEQGTLAVEGNYEITEFTGAVFTIYYFRGEGTSEKPYEIDTAVQLAGLADLVDAGNTNYHDKYYQLTADINLNVAPYNTGAGWKPIGFSTAFMGNFDGNNHVVSGLYINRTSYTYRYIGLFGGIKTGTIKNLGVEGTVIGGSENVGGLAGIIDSGVIIANCYANVSVSGGNYVGGLVGNSVYGNSITNCYATGSVSGGNYVGGLVGHFFYDYSVTNCYAMGTVSGNNNVGGVVGYIYNSSLTNCVALNSSLKRDEGSSSTNFGRVVGNIDGTLTGHYAWSGMKPLGGITFGIGSASIYADGTDVSDMQAMSQNFYETMGWKFGSNNENPWKMGIHNEYSLPVFYWQTKAPGTMPF